MITGFILTLKTTDWFPKEVRPVRPGLYMTKLTPNGRVLEGFSRWDSEHDWGFQAESIEESKSSFYLPEKAKDAGSREWMGLTTNPSAPFLDPTSLEAKVLFDISKELDISESGVYRRALMVYQLVHEEARKGNDLAFVDRFGSFKRHNQRG